MPSLGDKVRIYRERVRGLSQVAAADEIGISRSHLAMIEKNKYPGGRAALTKIADWMGLGLDYLLSEATAPQNGAYYVDDPDEVAWLQLGRELTPEERAAVALIIGTRFRRS